MKRMTHDYVVSIMIRNSIILPVLEKGFIRMNCYSYKLKW